MSIEDIDKMKKHVKKNWKPNMTMCDYDWFENRVGRGAELDWNLDKSFDGLMPDIAEDNKVKNKEKGPVNPKSLFCWYSWYFYKVAASLKYLTSKGIEKIKFDMHAGDFHVVLNRYFLNEKKLSKEQQQNIHSPNKFDRIFLR